MVGTRFELDISRHPNGQIQMTNKYNLISKGTNQIFHSTYCCLKFGTYKMLDISIENQKYEQSTRTFIPFSNHKIGQVLIPMYFMRIFIFKFR